MPRILIAIVDNIANEIIGPIQVFPHAAPAIRMFGDIASDQRTAVGAHVEDHHLVSLGFLNEDHTISPDKQVLITGAQWRAAQLPKEEK